MKRSRERAWALASETMTTVYHRSRCVSPFQWTFVPPEPTLTLLPPRPHVHRLALLGGTPLHHPVARLKRLQVLGGRTCIDDAEDAVLDVEVVGAVLGQHLEVGRVGLRSEERRVGKECR